MRTVHSYDYATIRIVPCAERGEFANAGVILHCTERAFLKSVVHVDESRLLALWPGLDLDLIRQHLGAFPKICAGDPDAGPIARLSHKERFHWLVAPRSTIIQTSAVHTGLCSDPEEALGRLVRKMVSREGDAQA